MGILGYVEQIVQQRKMEVKKIEEEKRAKEEIAKKIKDNFADKIHKELIELHGKHGLILERYGYRWDLSQKYKVLAVINVTEDDGEYQVEWEFNPEMKMEPSNYWASHKKGYRCGCCDVDEFAHEFALHLVDLL